MSRLTLRLPKTLHQQLSSLATKEGISLNQYIVYALTRQISSAYTVKAISKEDVAKQKESFENLLAHLKAADTEEIEKVLAQREVVESEPELSPDVIHRLKKKIKHKKKQGDRHP